MTIDIKSLGDAAARSLREKTAEKTQPQAYARQYVGILTAAVPRVKLPAILSLEQTKSLMEAAAVTRSHLREALAAARKDIRKHAADVQEKGTRRPRTSRAGTPAKVSPPPAKPDATSATSLADLFDDPLVPN